MKSGGVVSVKLEHTTKSIRFRVCRVAVVYRKVCMSSGVEENGYVRVD